MLRGKVSVRWRGEGEDEDASLSVTTLATRLLSRTLSHLYPSFAELQSSPRPLGCSHWPPRVSSSERATKLACNFVEGETAHSPTALRWADQFLRYVSLSGRFAAVHVRTGASSCNDSLPRGVRRLVRQQVPNHSVPVVFFTNANEKGYLDEIQRLLRPRKVIFADAVLRRMDDDLKNDNYLVFASERAIASKARWPFQIGYQPCGRTLKGWSGSWHP